MPKIIRLSVVLLSLITLIVVGTAFAADPAENLGWEVIVPGIDYQKFQLPDPNNIFVVRMLRSNPALTLESSIATGKLAEGRETVSGMFARYDQALNLWGVNTDPPDWGMRNQVIVAINGSYFDWKSGLPQGGQVQAGWYAKRYDKLGGRSGFAWKLDRSAFIGQCVFHRPDKQFVTYPETGVTQVISNVNSLRDTDQLVLYTPQYNTRTGTNDAGVEVVVEMSRPTMILPFPASASGFVRQIYDGQGNGQGNSLIPFNSVVLSASGTEAQTLLANVHIGSEVKISQEITSFLDDCTTLDTSISWTKTYASIQGDYYFLRNGTIVDYFDDGAVALNPRTAIAYTDKYIFFIVVDGRDSQHSIGMTIHQLAEFVSVTLGATFGVAQDGGGSSTMVINGKVVNNTYCNNYICDWDHSVYLPITRRANPEGLPKPPSPTSSERLVANGMLMVIVQPKEDSAMFAPGDQVTTLGDTSLRLGPGTNYADFTTIVSGTQGTITKQMNNLDGVLAKSSYWWYVNVGGIYGWLPQEALLSQAMNNAK